MNTSVGGSRRGESDLATAVTLILMWACGSCDAAQASSVPTPPPSVTVSEVVELDEVKVLGLKLYQMRERMIAAEERFYARYNELNRNNDFDVECKSEAPLGTRLRRRSCKPVYYANAQAEEAQAILRGDLPVDAQTVLLERMEEYRKQALAVINSDPKLRQLVREREKLEELYIKARNERMKGRWILFE
jgi:hypothetical protein